MNQPTNILCFSHLKGKEVVNASDGTLLGHVIDLELSHDLREVRALLLPHVGGLFSLSKREDVRISVSQIEQVGGDVILVRLSNVSKDGR